jgi:hypothetical protein
VLPTLANVFCLIIRKIRPLTEKFCRTHSPFYRSLFIDDYSDSWQRKIVKSIGNQWIEGSINYIKFCVKNVRQKIRPLFCHFSSILQKIRSRIFSAADISGVTIAFCDRISAGWQYCPKLCSTLSYSEKSSIIYTNKVKSLKMVWDLSLSTEADLKNYHFLWRDYYCVDFHTVIYPVLSFLVTETPSLSRRRRRIEIETFQSKDVASGRNRRFYFMNISRKLKAKQKTLQV